jgi:hypothetical protein
VWPSLRNHAEAVGEFFEGVIEQIVGLLRQVEERERENARPNGH